MEKILVVDDNEEIRKQLKWGLGKKYTVLLAGTASEALTLFRKNHPKAVILDLGLPPHEDGTEEGFKCLKEMLKVHVLTKIIVATGNEERETALRAIHIGAYDFYQKPIDLKELKVVSNRALHLHGIEEENTRLQHALAFGPGRLRGERRQRRHRPRMPDRLGGDDRRHLSIADGTLIGPGTLVSRTIATAGYYTGFFPLMTNRDWERNAAALRHLKELRTRVRALEARLRQQGTEDD